MSMNFSLIVIYTKKYKSISKMMSYSFVKP
jgi:hypothetical protein